MSVIGPRPGLWNQDILTAERDKYNANDVKPGLTGWAQINGRDELEIPVKAKLDGEYVKHMGLSMDLKCFLHIDNLCEFLCQIMLVKVTQDATVLIPQNSEWTKTTEMVKEIANVYNKKIVISKNLKPFVKIARVVPGKIRGLVNKAFGNMVYATSVSEYPEINYEVVNLKNSIKRTEIQKNVGSDDVQDVTFIILSPTFTTKEQIDKLYHDIECVFKEASNYYEDQCASACFW